MVFTLKPLSKTQQVATNASRSFKEKARMCVCGNFESSYESLYSNNSTTNPDSHTLRMFVAQQIGIDVKNGKEEERVIGLVDISNAFLNATLDEDSKDQKEKLLMKPPNILEALKIVPVGELWVPIGACYGFRSAPKRWEKTRDQELEGIKTRDWHLIQSKTHSGI
eukprot:3570677-Amphidinium_carterae.1